jgi:hypothetical protein
MEAQRTFSSKQKCQSGYNNYAIQRSCDLLESLRFTIVNANRWVAKLFLTVAAFAASHPFFFGAQIYRHTRHLTTVSRSAATYTFLSNCVRPGDAHLYVVAARPEMHGFQFSNRAGVSAIDVHLCVFNVVSNFTAPVAGA